MPTLPNMGLITPTLGGDSGTWDDKINACFALVDAHDHTSGKGVQVPVAGININADFAMAGQAVTGLGSVAFNAVTALTTGSKRLFVSSADNELYWRTNSGTNVKLTSGTSINTTLVGGITGDYSTVGAAVAYDDANKRYTFKTQTSTWARMASGPVRIYEYNTTESVYVEQAVDAALAASYTVTWPAALPAAAAFVLIDNTGAVSFTASPTIIGTITVSGIKFSSDQVMVLSAAALRQTGSTHVFNGNYWALGASSSDTLFASLPLKTGDRIKSVTVYIDKNTASTNTVTVELYRTDPATSGSIATLISSGTNAGNNDGVHTVGPTGMTEVVAAGHAYSVKVSQTTATAGDFIFTVEITYDRP